MPPVSEPPLPVGLPHTFRPFGVRMAVFVFGGLLVAVAAVVWFTFPPEIRDKFTLFQRGTIIVLGLGFLALGWGLARSRVEARREGLRIVNGYRSRSLDWNEVEIIRTEDPSHHDLHGRTVAAVAADRGADGLDTMLDLALADDLRTNFAIRRRTADAERAVIDQLLDHPQLMAGSSDGGAHLQTFCGADYTTRLISDHVPDRLSLEQAVAKLSFVPATSVGLWDRGLLRPGFATNMLTRMSPGNSSCRRKLQNALTITGPSPARPLVLAPTPKIQSRRTISM